MSLSLDKNEPTRTFTAPVPGPVQLHITCHVGQVKVTADPSCTTARVELRATDPAFRDAVQAARMDWSAQAITVAVPGGQQSVNVTRFSGSGTQINHFGSSVVVSGSNSGVIMTGNGSVIMSGGGVVVTGGSAAAGIELVATVPPLSSACLIGDAADATTKGELDRVEVRSQVGTVQVDAVQDVDVSTVGGDIRVAAVDGTARLRSTSGDVRVERTGSATHIKTISGDVQLDDFGGSADLASTSGDITVHATEGGTVTAKSVSGDVRVSGSQQAQAAGLAVAANSTSGRTSVPQPLSAPRSRRPRSENTP